MSILRLVKEFGSHEQDISDLCESKQGTVWENFQPEIVPIVINFLWKKAGKGSKILTLCRMVKAGYIQLEIHPFPNDASHNVLKSFLNESSVLP